ncbi:MAG: potassium channel family protein [Planctomycetota bacterium]|jgi:voltage-gated potassium channel
MHQETIYKELIARSKSALRLGVSAYFLGVAVFYILGCFVGMNAGYGRELTRLDDDLWGIEECLYHVGITFTTVGYTDKLGTDEVHIYRDTSGHFVAYNSMDGHVSIEPGQSVDVGSLALVEDFTLWTTVATVLLAVVGMGIFVYAIGAITAFFVEGAYLEVTLTKRTRKRIKKLSNHVIVCGAEATGQHAVERFIAEHADMVAVDQDDENIEHLREHFPDVIYLRGDPTDPATLEAAGIHRAQGLVTTLLDDNDNLVVVVTARQENPDLRILSRASGLSEVSRLQHAGARQVVSPAFIGGLRLASEAIRPTVVRLLDAFMGHEEERKGYRFAGIRVGAESPLCGRTLAEVKFYDATKTRVLSLRYPGEQAFLYNPDPNVRLEAGTTIGVIGDDESLERVENFVTLGNGGGGAA